MKCLVLAAALILPVPLFAAEGPAPVAAEVPAVAEWSSFLTAGQLHDQLGEPNLLILDVRSPDEYAAGHIPGAINLPGNAWRTGKAKPGQGDSQYIFREADGSPDVAVYEDLLSNAGVRNDHQIVVYGNHAGKGDGSIPAMILDWLGHDDVAFLDGVGLSEWQAAGFETVTETTVLPRSRYAADADESAIWDLDDVLAGLDRDEVVFLDTRSAAEFAGDPATLQKRGNARGGHIPGAVLLNYSDHLNDDKTVRSPQELAQQFADAGVKKDQVIVLYCQTATRVSLPYLALKDLGYENVKIYDASWHEYGNREDTPIETGEKKLAAK
jgi:thiosulfate/3-mercaptopyruvate sulfurtransferase